jgi:hypothetical protein
VRGPSVSNAKIAKKAVFFRGLWMRLRTQKDTCPSLYVDAVSLIATAGRKSF